MTHGAKDAASLYRTGRDDAERHVRFDQGTLLLERVAELPAGLDTWFRYDPRVNAHRASAHRYSAITGPLLAVLEALGQSASAESCLLAGAAPSMISARVSPWKTRAISKGGSDRQYFFSFILFTPTANNHLLTLSKNSLTASPTLGRVALAELGDKTQRVCMTLATRHPAAPVLLGAVLAFAVLNLLAVIFGAAVAAWPSERGLRLRWSD